MKCQRNGGSNSLANQRNGVMAAKMANINGIEISAASKAMAK
jgi:hypothetical protein